MQTPCGDDRGCYIKFFYVAWQTMQGIIEDIRVHRILIFLIFCASLAYSCFLAFYYEVFTVMHGQTHLRIAFEELAS